MNAETSSCRCSDFTVPQFHRLSNMLQRRVGFSRGDKGEEMNTRKDTKAMYRQGNNEIDVQPAKHRSSHMTFWPLLISSVVLALSVAPGSGQTINNNTPPFVFSAKDLGPLTTATRIDVSIWLKPHNRAELDALAAQLYDKSSPNYRKFLKHSEAAARFSPTAAEAETVKQFFIANNMKIVRVDPSNLFVRANGTVAQVQAAFHVLLDDYQVNNTVVRANNRDPYIDGPAAAVTRLVSGLDNASFEHPLVTAATAANALSGKISPRGGTVTAPHGNTETTTPPNFFTNNCFPGPGKEAYSTDNNGSFPIGTFSGNKLNEFTNTSFGCGYTPAELQTAYGLTTLYANGFDGAGQTIGIIDWCGSSTILADANGFSAEFGLPALTIGQNFTITYTPTPSECVGTGDFEINLDVEWAHAVAPGADINLIVPPSGNFQDIDEAELIAIDSGLANVLSGSYGAPEFEVSQAELENGNLINEIAAISGISANFSSGDAGDLSAQYGVTGVSYPADTPYATAIGGTSLVLNKDNSIKGQIGWGNNYVLLAEEGTVFDPPYQLGNEYGSGGGGSLCLVKDPSTFACISGFPKPSYQKLLPGEVRQLPDISWLADPFTPAVILISEPGYYPPQAWEGVGGTSLACPMFSALWAIANQEAGAELGQAAPYIYSMPATTITDIVPVSSPNATNVTSSIEYPNYVNNYNASQTAGVSGPFVSAIWDYPTYANTAVLVTFGTDTGLTVTKGWDNVTGVGVPKAAAFANYFLHEQ
jgi:subtilase family serine protease